MRTRCCSLDRLRHPHTAPRACYCCCCRCFPRSFWRAAAERRRLLWLEQLSVSAVAGVRRVIVFAAAVGLCFTAATKTNTLTQTEMVSLPHLRRGRRCFECGTVRELRRLRTRPCSDTPCGERDRAHHQGSHAGRRHGRTRRRHPTLKKHRMSGRLAHHTPKK